MDDKIYPEIIYEEGENAQYDRHISHNKTDTPNRKRTPMGLRNRRMRPQTSPSSHSSPRSNQEPKHAPTLPTPSPRCVSNPFDQGGIIMSPSALSVGGTPKSGFGWTLEQRSVMFPAYIEDELITSQYESPITEDVIEKNKSNCQQWLENTDLTSPWSSKVPDTKKKSIRPRLSKSFSAIKGSAQDASTQTNNSLPPDFNLFEFLEKHGAPLQSFNSRENSINGSANSSLRRKLFECANYSDDSESDGEDFNPISSSKYDFQSPNSRANIMKHYLPGTPLMEQFSSSPIKISPGASSTATTSPGALSYCGGGGGFGSPLNEVSPYRSPFRSPFGDPNISLSPIPKAQLFEDEKDDSRDEQIKDINDVARNLNFDATKNFSNDSDDDLDETAENIKNQSKVVSSSLENSLDVSMKSESWDVSAIARPEVSTRNNKNAESTHIQGNSISVFGNASLEDIKDEMDDVYMGSYSQESRGFSFCEPDEPAVEDEPTGNQTDSGINSGPNSRSESVLHTSKEKQNIPLPTFSTNVIYEDLK